MSNKKNHWGVLALGLSLGITWGVTLFILGIMACLKGWGIGLVSALSNLYIGYNATLLGSVLGLFWGFIDMFIGGVIIAWLYNVFSGKDKE